MSDECKQCGASYERVKPWQKFCTPLCKNRARGNRYYDPAVAAAYAQTPVFKYNVQKHGAKRRGIAFNLTFDEWWGLWEPHWERRGKAPDSLCMSRVGDTGAYELGNVYINTISNNCRDAAINIPTPRDTTTGRFTSDT